MFLVQSYSTVNLLRFGSRKLKVRKKAIFVYLASMRKKTHTVLGLFSSHIIKMAENNIWGLVTLADKAASITVSYNCIWKIIASILAYYVAI